MDTITVYNQCILWTRSMTLFCSVLILLLSLGTYNYQAFAVLQLAAETKQHHVLFTSMIGDRQLIATLVAAQASVFCPLFLILTSKPTLPQPPYAKSEVWYLVAEQFCFFMIPLVLSCSWIFCIIFDRKTETLLSVGVDRSSAVWDSMVYLANSLKFIVISTLVFEIIMIWLNAYEHAVVLSAGQPIQLQDDEEDEKYV